MGNTYRRAPEVADVGKQLIREHHRDLLKHAVRVEFLFCTDTPKKGGKNVWGQTRKISSLSAYLHGMDALEDDQANEPFFVVIIPEEIWERLKPQHREPLVDSLLMRCGVREDRWGTPTIYLADPDFVGFNEEVARWGLWRRDAREIYDVMKRKADPQTTFDFNGPTTDDGSSVATRTHVLRAVH